MKQQDLIEQSITRTYRPSIWSRFIKALKTFSLIKENDSLALILTNQKEDLLLAKLFMTLIKHSDFSFNITYFCLKNDYEFLKDNIEKLLLDVTIINSYEEVNSSYIIIKNHTFDDIINKTMYNLLYEGEYKTIIPKFNKEGRNYINPLVYIRDKDIDNFFIKNELNALDKIKSERELFIEKLIKDLLKRNQFIEMNIFKSATNVNTQKILGYKLKGEFVDFKENYKNQKM